MFCLCHWAMDRLPFTAAFPCRLHYTQLKSNRAPGIVLTQTPGRAPRPIMTWVYTTKFSLCERKLMKMKKDSIVITQPATYIWNECFYFFRFSQGLQLCQIDMIQDGFAGSSQTFKWVRSWGRCAKRLQGSKEEGTNQRAQDCKNSGDSASSCSPKTPLSVPELKDRQT